MIWIEAKVVFDPDEQRIACDLIADIFFDMGLQGVAIEDPDATPEEGWGDDAADIPVRFAVKGYIHENSRAEEAKALLEEKLAGLNRKIPINHKVSYSKIDEEDWAESWKEFFLPEKITDTIVVKPSWKDYAPEKNDIVIEIDPGMAFGTGTHPTTSMCVSLIEKHMKKGSTFLDVGTGSGILMIAAAKLGAKTVWGTDCDETAVDIAQHNLLLNQVDQSMFTIITANLADTIDRQFDIVVANILADVIKDLLEDVQKVLKRDGMFICSGMVESSRQDILAKMADGGLEPVDMIEKEGWVAIAGQYFS